MKISSIRMKLTAILITALFAASAWALPPQVEADGLMLEIKSQMDKSDYAGAIENFAKVEKLRVGLPETFNYHYGVALAGTGQWVNAQRKFDRYLTEAGAGGKFYKEALVEYNEVKVRAEREKRGKAAEASNLKQLAALGLSQGQALRDCPDCPPMVILAGPGAAPFAIGKYEVTQGQWKAVMGNNPSNFDNCGDNCPVEQVSWNDIQEFIRKLNASTGKQYRLPSDAEWEYACHGGSQNECGGDNLVTVGWYDGNSGKTTHAVGQKQANRYGLYDMSGNVSEWVSDCHEGDCATRVLRGGSWYNSPLGARAARSWFEPALRDNSFGFRLARMLP